MTHVDTPHSICRFGIARRDITPTVGTYHRMWGAAAHDRSTGVHRPLTATAVVFRSLDSAAEQQIVVALDHCLLWHPEMEALTERICQTADVEREQLIVTFSHTHAAGLMDPSRAEMPGGDMIAPYLKRMADLISEAVAEALASLQPATVTYATGRCALAAHRDFWDEQSGQFVCGFNPDAPADDTVLVARVTGEDNRTLATFVNYACHPTTLAWDNTLISPDYPGATREVVEEATAAPCVFLQGASGDLGPREGFVGDTDVADRNGRQLGYAALAALQSLPPPNTRMQYAGPVISGATIGVWNHQPLADDELHSKRQWQARRWTVDLRYRGDLPSVEQTRHELDQWLAAEQAARAVNDNAKAADARAMAERKRRALGRLAVLPPGDHFPIPVTAWRMGDAIWLAVEGEPYNLLQRELRQRLPDTPIIVIELAGGSRISYLPIAAAYGQGIYQESIALVAAGSLEQLIQNISQAIQGE